MSLRRSNALPDEVTRDLEAIDAALAGAAVDPDLRDLADLSLAVRDERPRPDAGAAARLDDRAASGFRDPAPTSASRRPRQWIPVAGGVASLATVTVLALSVAGDDAGVGGRVESDRSSAALAPPQTSPGNTADALQSEAEPPQSAPTGEAKTLTAPVPPPSATALGRPNPAPGPSAGSLSDEPVARNVTRGANLRLATTPRRLDGVAQGVVQVTDGVGGFVRNSAIDSRPGLGGGASFELEVPTDRLQTALTRLSRLANVRSRTESSADVTEQVTVARNRAAARRAERTALLRQLAAAKSLAETARIRDRLRSVEARLREANAGRAELRRRTTYSAVAVEVVTERAREGTGAAVWTPRDALGDAVRVLEVAAGVALVALAVLLPLSLLLALLWPIGRFTHRRWREQALGAAGGPGQPG